MTPHDDQRELRTAVTAFAGLVAGFTVLSAALIGVHGFTGMHDAAAAAPVAAAPAAPTTPVATDTTTTTSTTAAPAPAGPLVVEVVMDEFSYRPRRITVPAGRPVELRVVNAGAVDHELVIGDQHVQDEAEAAMRDGDHGGGHGHEGDVPSLYLAPGERGTIEATFDTPGTLLVGCHVPGHWDAGMRSFLDVEAS